MALIEIGEIGYGGFGLVHEVESEDGTRLARKTFHVNQPGTISAELLENVKKRFVREVKVQRSISHPNIVPVIADELSSEPPMFTMPLAECTLEDDIEQDRTLGGNFYAALMDIIAGLEELHSVEIYHRDLKPKNVLRFENENPDGTVGRYYAIGDFGFVSLRETQVSTVITEVGMRLGTDFYTAPEITADLRRGKAPADIYSLGCILHDFVGRDVRIPCGEIREEGKYGAILLNCTRRNPERRFKSVAAVRDALLSLESGEDEVTEENAKQLIGLISSEHGLTENQWNSIVDYLEGAELNVEVKAVLGQLTISRIEEVVDRYPGLVLRISPIFSQWIRETGFDYSLCDGLAIRLERLVQYDSLEVKADCLIAMLELGTSHNRWYVERKFVDNTSPTMDEKLARRLAVEFRVLDDEVCRSIDHLEHSISFSRSNFQPLLVETLSDICE